MRHDEPVRDVRRQTTNQGPSFHVPAHLTVHSPSVHSPIPSSLRVRSLGGPGDGMGSER